MLGDNLKQLRKIHNLTQDDLAKIIDVSRSTITKYERNERTPDLSTIIKIADYFNVSLDYLCSKEPQYNETIAYSIIKAMDDNGLIAKIEDIDTKLAKTFLRIFSNVVDDFINKENK